MLLETGRIGEAEFHAREKELLDQLDRIEERVNAPHKTKEWGKVPSR
jgi:hypothetical protein